MPIKSKAERKKYNTAHHRSYYKKNIIYREKQKNWVKNRKEGIIDWFKDYKKGLSCIVCGENHPACIDFHHKDKKTKDRPVCILVQCGVGKERIIKEIEKCDVLCANCHRKIHYLDNQIPL